MLEHADNNEQAFALVQVQKDVNIFESGSG